MLTPASLLSAAVTHIASTSRHPLAILRTAERAIVTWDMMAAILILVTRVSAERGGERGGNKGSRSHLPQLCSFTPVHTLLPICKTNSARKVSVYTSPKPSPRHAAINACQTAPCGNAASCVDKPPPADGSATGRTCTCLAGYSGNPDFYCESPLFVLVSSPFMMACRHVKACSGILHQSSSLLYHVSAPECPGCS